MVFCNKTRLNPIIIDGKVTILILIDGFLQSKIGLTYRKVKAVTILILIDGFLQCVYKNMYIVEKNSHNPYFNRWFSAIGFKKELEMRKGLVTILILIDGFLQYG